MSLNWLDAKYVSVVGGRCRNFKRISDSVWNFACPLCGDSKRHTRKARGYVTVRHGKGVYTCHKCGAYMPLFRFIQIFDRYLYADYQKERVVAGFWRPHSGRIGNLGSGPVSAPKVEPEQLDSRPPSDDALRPLLPLTRVSDLPEDHVAVQTCRSRLIPDLTRVYHCPKFYLWTNWVLREEKFKRGALYYDHPRLVIPFIMDGRVTAFQGRDYRADSDNKYITIRVDEDAPKVYGLDDFDDLRVGYAVEGPIDSMFIDNCLAFAGGDHSILNTLGFERKRLVVVYDNEPRSPTTRKKIERAIDDGYPVCIWPKAISQKDPNDMVKAGIDPRAVIDSNTYSGMMARLELSAWHG